MSRVEQATGEGCEAQRPTIRVGILVFEDVDLLDVMGPVEVLGVDTSPGGAGCPRIDISLVSAESGLEIKADPSLTFLANTRMCVDCASCERCRFDVLLVPGGVGLTRVLSRRDVCAWLQRAARDAGWVCSICAGALLLGAAGLLNGHMATTHWASLASLGLFPGVQVAAGYPRVIVSGDRISSGGVSAALDLAITLKAILLGERAGSEIELVLQYDPAPPYGAGRPDRADPVTLAGVSRWIRGSIEARNEVIRGLPP